jgi:hypothetical protein
MSASARKALIARLPAGYAGYVAVGLGAAIFMPICVSPDLET